MQDYSTEEVTVYALHEPGQPEAIRYIGITSRPLEVRLKAHLTSPWRPAEQASKRAEWIAALWAQGGEPGIRPLRVVDRTQAQEVEREFIASYEAAGVPLVNGIHTAQFRVECRVRMLEWWENRHQEQASRPQVQPWQAPRPAEEPRVDEAPHAYKLTISVPDDLYEVVAAMAEEEIRTVQQQTIFMLRQCVRAYRSGLAARATAVPAAPVPEQEGPQP